MSSWAVSFPAKVKFVGTKVIRTPSHLSQQALLRVDGGAVFTPAISQFGTGTTPVGSPSVDSTIAADVYLTINSVPDRGGAWTFGVVVQPLVMWLWIGGTLIVVGSVLSAIPGKRRRPTDPVSAPVAGAVPPPVPDLEPEVVLPAEVPAERLPVGAGEAP